MDDTAKVNTKDADNEEIEQEKSKKHDITMEEIEYESKRRRPNDSQGPHSIESGVSSAGEVSSDLSRNENVSPHEGLMEVVTQLQEEVKSKKLSIEALQSENNSLRLQNSSKLSNTDKNAFQQYKKKIEEYQAAVSQRDNVISQLQERLTQCIHQQEYLSESAQQADHFSREIETLKLQLKEATDFLGNQKWLSGVNPKEHMELKHKLISIQQERAQDQAMISQLTQQMHTKTEAYGHLDYKYKLLLRNHKQTVDNHKTEAAKHTSEMQQFHLEKEGFENRMKEEITKLEKQHQDDLEETKQKSAKDVEDFVLRLDKSEEEIEKKNKEMEESKEKSSKEIQELMQQLQSLTQDLATNLQEHSDLFTSSQKEKSDQLELQKNTIEKQFGQEISVIKQQMSNLHQEELAKIKNKHASELNEVTKQIDALERVQKEDSQTMVESLASLTSLNEGLRLQLNVEQGKVSSLETQLAELATIKEQVEKYVVVNKNLEEQIKDEQNKQQSLKNFYNSVKDNSMKEHSELQEQMLYQGEQRLKLEELLSEEQKKVKEISEQKDLLEKENRKYSDINLQLTVECNDLKSAKDNVNKQLQQIEISLNQVKDHLKERKENCEKYEKAYEELRLEKQNWVMEKEAHLREKENISLVNIEFEKLEESIKEEIQARIQLSQEKEDICAQFTQLENKCQELSQYQEKCHSLTQKIAQMIKNIDNKEQVVNTLKGLKEIYFTVCNDCKLHVSNRQKIAELYNEKYLKINENVKISSKYDANLSTQEEKDKVSEELKEVNNINNNIKSENNALTKMIEEIRSQNEVLEIKLTETKSQIESLTTEMKQSQLHCKTMEQEKNEVETERDQLMEQYRVLEAEYSSTIMKLDREVQLVSQHGITSDVGVNVGTSMSDHETALQSEVSELKHKTSASDSCLEHPSEISDNSSVEGDLLVEEVTVNPEMLQSEAHLSVSAREPAKRNVSKPTPDSSKDEKSLLNEIEKLKTTVDEQHYAIGSLENENSSLKRALKQLKLEKSNRKSIIEKYQQELSIKLKLQQQVSELKLAHDMLENNLKHAESETINLKEALMVIRNSQEKEANAERTLQDFDSRAHNSTMKECLDNQEILHHNLHNQSQIMGNMRVEIMDRCKELLALQEFAEILHKEKNKSEEETQLLRTEIEKISHFIQSKGYDTKDLDISNTSIELTNKDSDTYKSKVKSLEDELNEKNSTNNKLRMEIKHTKVLHQLEKLQLQAEQPFIKMGYSKLSDHYLVNFVDGLEHLLHSWKNKAKEEPVIREFVNIQIHKVYNLMREATNMEDCYENSASVAKLATRALHPVFTVAVK
ncbi:unnamed protein product, partial [Meganyctiphanes norvegica]